MKIVRPTLVLDKSICLRNIERMAKKAAENGLRFRPHFKTHQSPEIGEWFRIYGVNAITVSSYSMAKKFAGYGWNDITLAFPLNILELKQINELAGKIKLNILIENREAATVLAEKATNPLGVFIKIDTGYHRTGIEASRTGFIQSIINIFSINPQLTFKGFITHAGNNYHASSVNEIFTRHFDGLVTFRSLRKKFQKKYPGIEISIGDTPSCSVCNNFNGIDEIRPGNFVFYDLTQYELGACGFEDIAVKMVCPVVAKHSARNEVVIYGGAVHLSKESIINVNGKPMYGRIVLTKNDKKELLGPMNYVQSLSQEHGILKVEQKQFGHFAPGDLVEIVPVHSCLTANLMRRYITTDDHKVLTINN